MWLAGRARWAIAASVGVHALLVVVCVALVRRGPESSAPRAKLIDTRITFVAQTPEPPAAPLAVAPPEPNPPPPDPPPSPDPPAAPPEAPAAPPETPAVEVVGPPVVRSFVPPAVLPPGLLARVRDFAPAAAPPDPAVTPAAGATPPPPRPAARPAHGALAAGQRVVYLLDASGSMGEWGKFDAARDVLVATLAHQPAAVEVRVVVYAATAEVVAPTALAARAPGGRGDHLAGLRAALEHRPDFVVWFTDSDDLPTAALRNAVRRMGKPVTVVVSRVGATGVAAPAELR
ncbi:VWA domain-containing protein [bacterium]|nr:VWA domain-containing protein [bacterium]